MRLDCPFCDDYRQSLAVYETKVHCFKCGYHTDHATFAAESGRGVSELAALSQRDGSGAGRVKFAYNPGHARVMVDVWTRTLTAGPRLARADYLYDRGIWPQTITKERLGHTGTHFVIPVWERGSLAGYKLRADPEYTDPDGPKYLQRSAAASLVYRPAPGSGEIIICEGEFDALILAQLGVDAITSTGGAGSLASTLASLRFRRPIYLATDQDDAGEDAAMQLAALFPTALRCRWEGANDVTDRMLAIDGKQAELQRWLDTAEKVTGASLSGYGRGAM